MSTRNTAPGRSPRMLSIRLRLTLWNVGVLAFILVGLGMTLRYTLKATLLASVDRSLEHQAQGMQDLAAQFGTSPPPMPPRLRLPHQSPRFWPQVLDTRGRPTPGMPPAQDHIPVPYDASAFRRARGGQTVYETEQIQGEPVRLLAIPLSHGGTIIGVALLIRPLTDTYQEVRRLTGVLVTLAAPVLLIAGLGGAFLTSRALRPVRQITHAAGRIEAEDLSRRLEVAGRDEISELAATFNGMLERLQESFEQRAAAYGRLEAANARLEAANAQQRRFTADASHELKTPLTVIEGTVSLALSGERTASQYRQSLETVGRSAGMMTRIVQDLLLLARSDAGELILDTRDVRIADVLALARETVACEAGPEIFLDAHPPDLWVNGDPSHLTRLFANLMDNAVRHTPLESCIQITAEADETLVTVMVTDTGTGIAPEHLPHVFERFYRVDAARARRHGGTGLGLAICRSIVEAHGGDLAMESSLGEGTRVRVRLPRASRAPAAEVSLPAREPVAMPMGG